MLARLPPLRHAWVGEQVTHRPLNLIPRRSAEYITDSREIHPLEVLEETSKERAEPDFGHRVELVERLQAAKINRAELRAIVKGLHELTPLTCQSVYRSVASLL